MDLAQFIKDRLDEDERQGIPQTVMHSGGPPGPWIPNCVGPDGRGCPSGGWRIDAPDPVAERAHSMTHQTAEQVRVLRGVEAKRRIVDHVMSQSWCGDEPRFIPTYWTDVLRMLASEWSTHPDYQQEWLV